MVQLFKQQSSIRAARQGVSVAAASKHSVGASRGYIDGHERESSSAIFAAHQAVVSRSRQTDGAGGSAGEGVDPGIQNQLMAGFMSAVMGSPWLSILLIVAFIVEASLSFWRKYQFGLAAGLSPSRALAVSRPPFEVAVLGTACTLLLAASVSAGLHLLGTGSQCCASNLQVKYPSQSTAPIGSYQ